MSALDLVALSGVADVELDEDAQVAFYELLMDTIEEDSAWRAVMASDGYILVIVEGIDPAGIAAGLVPDGYACLDPAYMARFA